MSPAALAVSSALHSKRGSRDVSMSSTQPSALSMFADVKSRVGSQCHERWYCPKPNHLCLFPLALFCPSKVPFTCASRVSPTVTVSGYDPGGSRWIYGVTRVIGESKPIIWLNILSYSQLISAEDTRITGYVLLAEDQSMYVDLIFHAWSSYGLPSSSTGFYWYQHTTQKSQWYTTSCYQ